MDESGSVGTNGFTQMKTFVKDVIVGLNSPIFRFGVLTYSSNVTKIFGFSQFTRLSDILAAIDSIRYSSGGSTYTGKGLEYARTSIFNTKREDAANIVILFTDGQSTDSSATEREAALLRRQEVRIFSIGVGSGPNVEELSLIASSPSSEHVFQVSSFSALSEILRSVQNRTCEGKG